MSTSQNNGGSSLDHDYGSGRFTTIYGALTTTAPSMTGAGTIVEPTGGQYDTYARVALTDDTTHWPNAAAGVKTTGVDFHFPIAGSGSTPNIPLTHLVFMTAPTGGTILDSIPLPAGTVVVIGQGLFFPAGSIHLTE